MTEALQKEANAIKDALRNTTGQGIEGLLDFAQRFAVPPEMEDAVLVKKTEWLEAATEEVRQECIAQLEDIADRIVQQYNPQALAAALQQEEALEQLTEKRPPRQDIVLVAEYIVKKYPGSHFTLEADKIEMRLGEITGLVGENATGKTTLLRILAGDLAPDKGVVRYPLFDPHNKKHWPGLKRKIAYVPQELPKWNGSLRENLHYEASVHGIKDAANRRAVEYIIQRLGLAMHLDKTWEELSGGYKLRFSLAKALVWNAQFLVVDEPLAFLDIKTQIVVLNDLKNLARSLRHPISIVLSSQHLHEIEAVADQMLFMQGGKLEHLGSKAGYRYEREQNVFEIGSPLPFQAFSRHLAGFRYYKTWSNGMTYFVSTPVETTGVELFQFLAGQQVTVEYYRDISRSVKTRFYAENL